MLPLYSTHSVNQLMTNCKSSNTTAGKAPVRPSSPRQFFARLYGHLEPGNNETESPGSVLSKVKSLNMSANDDNNNKSLPSTSNNNNNDVNYQSDGSSTSSSDLYIMFAISHLLNHIDHAVSSSEGKNLKEIKLTWLRFYNTREGYVIDIIVEEWTASRRSEGSRTLGSRDWINSNNS
ncbi:hypothetical protein GQX74_006239 [Glossina fuscipes]|nr:hypothetical protein GQX74_006239 [Glossina fuscipes]